MTAKHPIEDNQNATNEANSEIIGKKFGYYALIGPSNAGKSSLTNLLAATKIAIVSHKPQTTRFAVTAILENEDKQIAFIDTPGIFQGDTQFDKKMVKSAWQAIEGVHRVLLMITANGGITKNIKMIYERLKERNIKPIIIINKIDLVPKARNLELLQKLTQMGYNDAVFMISVKKNDGISQLFQYLWDILPEAAWQFQDGELTDQNNNDFCAELTREALMNHTHQEIPYGLMVETNKYIVRDNGSIYIYQTIHVKRANHKPIIIGKSGSKLKAIARNARIAMEQALHARVFLEVFVRITEDWQTKGV